MKLSDVGGDAGVDAASDAAIRKERVAKLKMRTKKEKEEIKKGVVLLSHIPKGFYEPQMFDFFSQFGEVTRLKLHRSKKTGNSKHFAFVEFRFREVAEIVAQTMNNYLMFQKILKCKVIPNSEVKNSTFKNWQVKYEPPKHRQRSIKIYNTTLIDPEKIKRKQEKTESRRRALQGKLNDLGIDYDVMNVKKNEMFVPAERTRATEEDIKFLRRDLEDVGGQCSDFDYSDDEDVATEGVAEVSESQTGDSSNQIAVDDDIDEKEVVEVSPEAEIVTEKNEDYEEGSSDFGVMVVDSDDSEIAFKSPPAEAKIKRRAAKNLIDTSSTNLENTTVTSYASAKQKRRRTLQQLQKTLDSDDEDGFDVTKADETSPIETKKDRTSYSAKKKVLRKRKSLGKP